MPVAWVRDWQRAHWAKRWRQPRLDWYMGGKGIQGNQREHARFLVKHVRARSVVDVGAGCWVFLAYLRKLGVERLAGTELPVERARELAPPFVEAHFAERPWPLPWQDKAFDVAYQNNAVCAMPASDVERVLDEMARVARWVAWGACYHNRFWDLPEPPGEPWHARTEWLIDRLAERAKLVRVCDRELTLWRAKG